MSENFVYTPLPTTHAPNTSKLYNLDNHIHKFKKRPDFNGNTIKQCTLCRIRCIPKTIGHMSIFEKSSFDLTSISKELDIINGDCIVFKEEVPYKTKSIDYHHLWKKSINSVMKRNRFKRTILVYNMYKYPNVFIEKTTSGTVGVNTTVVGNTTVGVNKDNYIRKPLHSPQPSRADDGIVYRKDGHVFLHGKKITWIVRPAEEIHSDYVTVIPFDKRNIFNKKKN
jgi:hypothetical protein